MREKLLGVTHDHLDPFNTHANKIAERMGSRSKVLKATAGSVCGNGKETLTATYRVNGRSL